MKVSRPLVEAAAAAVSTLLRVPSSEDPMLRPHLRIQ